MNETESEFLDNELRRLPRAIKPARNLWPGIERKLRRRSQMPRLFAYAAAAMVLVAVGAVGMFFAMHVGSNGPMVVATSKVPTVYPDASYFARRRAFVMQALSASSNLDPHTRRILPRELAMVETSIEHLEAALQADPGNPALVQLLNQSYRTEAELLNAATQISPAQITNRRAL